MPYEVRGSDSDFDRNGWIIKPPPPPPLCPSTAWWCNRGFTIACFQAVCYEFRGREGFGWTMNDGLRPPGSWYGLHCAKNRGSQYVDHTVLRIEDFSRWITQSEELRISKRLLPCAQCEGFSLRCVSKS